MRKLNPGYKLLTLIIASLLLSVTFHVELNLLVCLLSLLTILFTPGVNRKRLLLSLIPFTTDSMELVMSLMQQFHLPPKFAYGILAAYHFFPIVREEYRTVGASLQVRGVKAGPFSPKRLFPMLAHALERSESLAMAMESRGFENKKPRAVAFRVELKGIDFVFLIGLNAALAAGLIFL